MKNLLQSCLFLLLCNTSQAMHEEIKITDIRPGQIITLCDDEKTIKITGNELTPDENGYIDRWNYRNIDVFNNIPHNVLGGNQDAYKRLAIEFAIDQKINNLIHSSIVLQLAKDPLSVPPGHAAKGYSIQLEHNSIEITLAHIFKE